jgi:hypothetical protein
VPCDHPHPVAVPYPPPQPSFVCPLNERRRPPVRHYATSLSLPPPHITDPPTLPPLMPVCAPRRSTPCVQVSDGRFYFNVSGLLPSTRYSIVVTAESEIVEGLLRDCVPVVADTLPPVPCPNDCSGHGEPPVCPPSASFLPLFLSAAAAPIRDRWIFHRHPHTTQYPLPSPSR